MEPEFFGLTPKYGVYGTLVLVALFGLSKVLPQIVQSWFSTQLGAADTTARTDIIETMAAQLARLDAAVKALEAKNEDERQRRIAAEDRVATLTRRVATLEDQIRQLGHVPV